MPTAIQLRLSFETLSEEAAALRKLKIAEHALDAAVKAAEQAAQRRNELHKAWYFARYGVQL